jgi:hypothetical protein
MIDEEIQEDIYVENKYEYYVAKGTTSGEARYRARRDLKEILDNSSGKYKNWKDAHMSIKYYNQNFEAIRAKRNATHNTAGSMGRTGVNPTADNAASSGGRVVNGTKLEFRLVEQHEN